MNILLTGASGIVGRNILEHDLAENHIFECPSSDVLDLRDLNAIRTYLEQLKPDLVIHAAGTVGGIHANIAEPVKFLTDNLYMGTNLVLAARELGIPKFLNIGSSCMYPRNLDVPLTEDLILQGELEPTNEGYALAKIAVQRLCSYVSRESGDLQYKTLIPCNLFGRFDNFSPESSHLLAAIIHKVHNALEKGDEEIVIWGDGKARREFMYAGDLADAVLWSIEQYSELPELLNLGVGVDCTVTEYYERVAAVIGWQGTFNYDLDKPAGMKRKLLDVSKQTSLGWTPVTDLEVSIKKTYHYYLSNFRS